MQLLDVVAAADTFAVDEDVRYRPSTSHFVKCVLESLAEIVLV